MFGDDTTVVDLVLLAFWMLRDVFLIGIPVYTFVALFNARERGRAIVFWSAALVGTLASLIIPNPDTGLLGITDEVAIISLVVAGVFLGIGPRLQAAVRG